MPKRILRIQSSGRAILGQRMTAAFEACLADSDSVCIVGTDIPSITLSTFCDAFDALAEQDVVLGPGEDGGYYLIGLSEPSGALFDEVPWSTDAVFDVTSRRATAGGLSVAVLDRLADVDTVDDLPGSFL